MVFIIIDALFQASLVSFCSVFLLDSGLHVMCGRSMHQQQMLRMREIVSDRKL